MNGDPHTDLPAAKRPLANLDQLAKRESEQTEWKENVADVNDVVETLSAFANDLQNLGGGNVVCGAREGRDSHGFPTLIRTGLTAARLKEIEGVVLARCRDRVSPPITPLVEEQDADDPSRRILVFIQPATGAAHTFRRDRDGAKHFVRVSRETIEARNGILRDLLVRNSGLEPWDRRICSGATEADVDLLALRETLLEMKFPLPDGDVRPYVSDSTQLTPLAPSLFVREPLTGLLRPRNATILLFGRHTQQFIPGAVVYFSFYPGTDRSVSHAKRYELSGSVVEQVRRLRALLDLQSYVVFNKRDLAQPNIIHYPQPALYEAMGNAIVHRDYERYEPLRVTVFSDRIEFVSPGSLPLGVSIDAIRTGKATPKWRNQTLSWFFSRLQFAQAEGQGIPTILRTMRETGAPLPQFEADETQVSCILPAHPRHLVPAGSLISHEGKEAVATQRIAKPADQPADPSAEEEVNSFSRDGKKLFNTLRRRIVDTVAGSEKVMELLSRQLSLVPLSGLPAPAEQITDALLAKRFEDVKEILLNSHESLEKPDQNDARKIGKIARLTLPWLYVCSGVNSNQLFTKGDQGILLGVLAIPAGIESMAALIMAGLDRNEVHWSKEKESFPKAENQLSLKWRSEEGMAATDVDEIRQDLYKRIEIPGDATTAEQQRDAINIQMEFEFTKKGKRYYLLCDPAPTDAEALQIHNARIQAIQAHFPVLAMVELDGKLQTRDQRLFNEIRDLLHQEGV